MIDLIVSDQIVDLEKREADIAVRHSRPHKGISLQSSRAPSLSAYASSITLTDWQTIHHGDRATRHLSVRTAGHLHLAL